MSKAIVLSIGYDCYVCPAKVGQAGKLIELLNDIVPARKDFSIRTGEDMFRLQPRRAKVSVAIVDTAQILPPADDDFSGPDVVDIKALPGAMRLLKGGRS